MLDLCCIALGLHIGTWHTDRDRGLRDFNPGIYARVDRWQFGLYHNSQRAQSLYASYAFPLSRRWAIHVGAVTGYDHARIAPAVVLSYSFDGGVRLVGIPSTPKNSGGVHLAYEFHQGERK